MYTNNAYAIEVMESLESLEPINASANIQEVESQISSWLKHSILKITELEISDIDLNYTFDDYGIDSIGAIKLIGQLGDWLGEEISATTLYQFTNLKELISYLTELAKANAQKAVKNTMLKCQTIIAASFTAEPITESLKYLSEKMNIDLSLRFASYNQIFQELMSPQSDMHHNEQGINIILLRIEDWFRYSKSGIDFADLASMVKTFTEAMISAATNSRAKWVVCLCPHSLNILNCRETHEKIAEFDQVICTQLSIHPQIRLLDLRDNHNYFKTDPDLIYDLTRDKVGHIPYTQHYFSGLGLAVMRTIYSWITPSAKVIVLDCDNTLWSGISGEDDLSKINISPPFQFLQQFMLQQRQKGKLLCVCSKNIEDDVWTVFEKHSDMQLTRQDIVAYQINWEPKSKNLRNLAQQLGLSLNSFIFIDDNPAECAEVSANTPEVLVLQLPKKPEEIQEFLISHWAFDTFRVTEEDIRRSQMYEQNQLRDALRSNIKSYDQFLAELGLDIIIQPLENVDVERAAQLTERTNQFNATTCRRSETELLSLLKKQEHYGLTVRVSDRFGDYGLVGLMLVFVKDNCLVIESFMLSCRVLGKKVEHEMIRYLAKFAVDKKLNTLGLNYLPTNRNKPIYDFYVSLGFPTDIQGNSYPTYLLDLKQIETILLNAKTNYHDSTTVADNNESLLISTSGYINSSKLQEIACYYGNAIQILEALRSIKRERPLLRSQYVSPRTPWQTKLAELWSDILGISKIGINDNFYDLGGDSLRSAELAARLVDIGAPNNLSLSSIATHTVAGLAQTIEDIQAGREITLTSALTSLADEAKLDSGLQIKIQPTPGLVDSKAILLTGSTGYVGAFLLAQLLTQTHATVYCLVRAKQAEEALLRIQNNLNSYDLWQDHFIDRIKVLVGDLAKPLFNLSMPEFNQLAQQLDMVIHNGAWVNFVYPYELLKAANVDGTNTILELVTQGKSKSLHFISTLGVLMSGGYGRERKLFEDEDLDHSEDLPNGYEQTKWVADKLVWKAIQKGLPASIYRLGMLSGLGDSGIYHKLNEFLPSFLKGCVQLGSFPQIDSKIEMVPIDFITRAFFAILENSTNLGRVYQMNHPEALSDRDYVKWISNYGYPLRHLPWDIWKEELLGLGSSVRRNALYPYLDFIRALQYHQTYMPEMDMSNFIGVVKQKNINCPTQVELLEKYFNYFVKIGYLPGALL